MKTNKQNKQEKTVRPSTINHQQSTTEELQSRSEQLSGNSNNTDNQTAPRKSFTEAMAEVDAAKRNPLATEKAPEKDKTTETAPNGGRPQGLRPYVNFEEREHNRQLPVDKVLAVLQRWMPRQYELAEVVGKWIWITFPEQPIERVRAELSQLGFHWNNTRKCWQHPCGQTETSGSTADPRQKYGSHFVADQVAA